MRISSFVVATSFASFFIFTPACSSSNTDSNTPIVEAGADVEAGDSNVDTICADAGSSDACLRCCVNNHLTGAKMFVNVMSQCACAGTGATDGGRGVCADACAASACQGYDADSACVACESQQAYQDACTGAIYEECYANTGCAMLLACNSACQ